MYRNSEYFEEDVKIEIDDKKYIQTVHTEKIKYPCNQCAKINLLYFVKVTYRRYNISEAESLIKITSDFRQ